MCEPTGCIREVHCEVSTTLPSLQGLSLASMEIILLAMGLPNCFDVEICWYHITGDFIPQVLNFCGHHDSVFLSVLIEGHQEHSPIFGQEGSGVKFFLCIFHELAFLP